MQEELKKSGVKNILSGAIQYNWRNYYRVTIGDKKEIDRFEVSDFDILSPLNYAGHKMYKHAIDLLHSSGNSYIDYLKAKSYRKDEYSDLEGAIKRSVDCAKKTGLTLEGDSELVDNKEYDNEQILPRYKNGPFQITNPISKKIIQTVMRNVTNLESQQENDGIPK